VLPGLTSMQIARSFKQTILMSPIFGLVSVVLGMFLSIIEPNAAPGGSIVLVGLALLVAAMAAKRIKGLF